MAVFADVDDFSRCTKERAKFYSADETPRRSAPFDIGDPDAITGFIPLGAEHDRASIMGQ
jgi:hypothetical protein